MTKGVQVIVQGRLKQRSFETSEGEKRTVFEIDVDDIGPTLRFATAKVTKATRSPGSAGDSSGWRPANGGGREQFAQQRTQGQTQRSQGAAESDPWSTSNPGGGWGGSFRDEPPF